MTIQLIFLHFAGVHYFRIIPRDLWRIFHSFILILSGLVLIKHPLENRKWISFVIQSLYVIIQCSFIGYFVKTKQSFDFAVVAENFNEIFYSESLFVIFNGIDPTAIYIGLIGIGIIFYKTIRTPCLSKIIPFNIQKYSVVLTVYLLFVVIPVIQFDQMTNFFRSVVSYYFKSPEYEYEFNIKKDEFPFITKIDATEKVSLNDKPNIFLIMVESFNAGFVNSSSDDEKFYTPFFNSLIKNGVYIDQFYGNSV